MARNTDIKLPILCDGQSQTTLGGLSLRTQCGAQRMFHHPPLLMRVSLQGSQVWIVHIVRGKWCYRSHSSVAVIQLTLVAPQWTGQHQQSSMKFRDYISKKYRQKYRGNFSRTYRYRYRWYFWQKVSVSISAMLFESIVNNPGWNWWWWYSVDGLMCRWCRAGTHHWRKRLFQDNLCRWIVNMCSKVHTWKPFSHQYLFVGLVFVK